MTGVFKIRIDGDKMTEVGYMWRDINLKYHGAYAFVAKDGVYYAAGNDYIGGYNNQNSSDPESPIVEVKRHNLTGLHPNEHIVGLSLTWDDYIVYVTNYGIMGAISKDFTF